MLAKAAKTVRYSSASSINSKLITSVSDNAFAMVETTTVLVAAPEGATSAAASAPAVTTTTTTATATAASTVAWTDHKALILHGVRDLFDSGRHSDFVIRCHSRSFRVHKLVLGLFTDYFRRCDGLWIRINVNPELMEKVIGQKQFNSCIFFVTSNLGASFIA